MRVTRHRASLAVFVSPHGFGHAARACAVMQALADLDPSVRFEVFTLVPEWFFAASLSNPFGYHPLLTDVGLAQRTPLEEDLGETLTRLTQFLPFAEPSLDELAGRLASLECRGVLADISPLGLAVAKRAGLPSFLVENFTWEWIYEPYTARRSAFAGAIRILAELTAGADLRIQTEPVCRRDERWPLVPPVSRAPRAAPESVRRRLGIPEGAPAVLVTMGGVPWRPADLGRLEACGAAYLVVPGAAERPQRRGRLVALPHRSQFFHPDLVRCVDAVIGKLGYSTVAEVHAAGVPFGYVARPTFRESSVLEAFVKHELPGLAVAAEDFESGAWLDDVPRLLAIPRASAARSNGAEAAARIVRAAEARG